MHFFSRRALNGRKNVMAQKSRRNQTARYQKENSDDDKPIFLLANEEKVLAIVLCAKRKQNLQQLANCIGWATHLDISSKTFFYIYRFKSPSYTTKKLHMTSPTFMIL